MSESSLYRVLWLDDDPDILAAAHRLAYGQEWTVVGVGSISEAHRALTDQGFAVIVADERLSLGRGMDFLAELHHQRPAVTRILLTGAIDSNLAREAINRCRVFRLVNKPWVDADVRRVISEGIVRHTHLVDQKTLLREINVQNRDLEKLTFGLEQIVRERTRRIERSKNEAEANLSILRDLVRFVKNLSELTSLDEFYLLLRREFRRYRGVKDPLVSYLGPDQKQRIIYFASGSIVVKEVDGQWPGALSEEVDLLPFRQFFANMMGRPLGQLIRFTLSVPHHFRDQGGGGDASLFVEHAFAPDDMAHFIQNVEGLLQPMSIAFDRMLVEEQMQYASYQWASTFDAIQDPVAIINSDRQIIRANSHFARKKGAQRCFSSCFGVEESCEGCPLDDAVSTGQAQHAFIRIGERVFNVSSYPILLDSTQQASSVVNHYIDITDSRELYVQMIQNEKMAAIGLLAGNVAHELNNPLTGIRNLAQLALADTPVDTDLYNDLLEVEKASARCQRVIADLLDFSEGGGVGWQVVRLGDIVKKTLPLLKTALHNFQLELRLIEEDDWVRVEPQLLQQVIFNLLNNACQAMGLSGTLHVETVLNHTNSQDIRVDLRISDTGPGIPLERLEKIFEPFYTTKPTGQGTGLGLSISRTIVERFGGTLEVTSELGKGSEFTLSLAYFEESTHESSHC